MCDPKYGIVGANGLNFISCNRKMNSFSTDSLARLSADPDKIWCLVEVCLFIDVHSCFIHMTIVSWGESQVTV